ncbi:MAG: SRPBCC domain-containing protein [Campylobacteraceae bacterium]|jgi:hypothetical protein|nr:SRPBCC domain-containing protein [Campylobacteraceae bacterium]
MKSTQRRSSFSINTEIKINAKPEVIWEILVDFDNYPKWNPFIKMVKGEVKVGNKITVKVVPQGKRGMTFKPKVLTFEKNREISWIGKLIISGLFDGEHKLILIDNNDGTTTFKQSEKFDGILVTLFNFENTRLGFEAMNQELKKIAEAKL